MLRYAFTSLVIGALLLACGDDDDLQATTPPPPGPGITGETECSAPTDCADLVCLTFKTNPQNKTGICTRGCNTKADCGAGICVDFASALGSSTARNACLASCATDADCKNGFACVTTAQGPGCLVHPQ